MEGEVVTLQDLFVFDHRAGLDEHGRHQGTMRWTGLRPRFLDTLANAGIPVPPGDCYRVRRGDVRRRGACAVAAVAARSRCRLAATPAQADGALPLVGRRGRPGQVRLVARAAGGGSPGVAVPTGTVSRDGYALPAAVTPGARAGRPHRRAP